MSDSDDSISSNENEHGFVRRYYRDMQLLKLAASNSDAAAAASSSPLTRNNAQPLQLRQHQSSVGSGVVQLSQQRQIVETARMAQQRDISRATDAVWAWTAASTLPRAPPAPPPPRRKRGDDNNSNGDDDKPSPSAILLRNSLLAAIRQLPSDLCFFDTPTQRWELKDSAVHDLQHGDNSSNNSRELPHRVINRILSFANEVNMLSNFAANATEINPMSHEDDGGFVSARSVAYFAVGSVASHVVHRVVLWASQQSQQLQQQQQQLQPRNLLQLLSVIDTTLRPAVKCLLGLAETVRLHLIDASGGSDDNNNEDRAAHFVDCVDALAAHCDTHAGCVAVVGIGGAASLAWIYRATLLIALATAFVVNMRRVFFFRSQQQQQDAAGDDEDITAAVVVEPVFLAPRTLADCSGTTSREMRLLLHEMLHFSEIQLRARYRATVAGLKASLCRNNFDSNNNTDALDSSDAQECVSCELLQTQAQQANHQAVLHINDEGQLRFQQREQQQQQQQQPQQNDPRQVPLLISSCEAASSFFARAAGAVAQSELRALRVEARKLLLFGAAASSQPSSSLRPLFDSLRLIKQLALFQAWATLQECLVDRILFTAQPAFCARTGFLPAGGASAAKVIAASATSSASYLAPVQRWFHDVLDKEGIDSELALVFAVTNSTATTTNYTRTDNGDATGAMLVRALATVQLRLTLHPAVAAIFPKDGGAVLSGVFSSLLTLTVAVRRLQTEFKASRQQSANRSYWRLLHTCSFALDAVLRFVTTEVQALMEKLERDLDAEINGSNNNSNTHGGRCAFAALEQHFDEFIEGLRGVAVAASGTGVAHAIANHVATLCAVACDSARWQQQQQPSSDNTAVKNTNAASNQAQLLDREIQRVDLTCRSLVAVLRGLRIETRDPVIERRCSAMLATLTFNRFF